MVLLFPASWPWPTRPARPRAPGRRVTGGSAPSPRPAWPGPRRGAADPGPGPRRLCGGASRTSSPGAQARAWFGTIDRSRLLAEAARSPHAPPPSPRPGVTVSRPWARKPSLAQIRALAPLQSVEERLWLGAHVRTRLQRARALAAEGHRWCTAVPSARGHSERARRRPRPQRGGFRPGIHRSATRTRSGWHVARLGRGDRGMVGAHRARPRSWWTRTSIGSRFIRAARRAPI